MEYRQRNTLGLLVCTLALFLAGTALRADAAEGSFDRTLKVSGAVELDVTTGSGNITVRAGEAATVRVHGTIRARGGWNFTEEQAERKVRALEANPPIEQLGSIIRIGHIQDPDLRRNVSISFELVVPAESQLTSQTGSGNQTIQGIRGPLKVGSGSGSLKISDIGDEVRAETGSGDIEIDSVRGSVRLNAGSGSIRGEGIAGAIVAETGSGNLKLSQTAPGPVKVETGSGSAEIVGVRGSLHARAGSGDITAQGEPQGEWNLQTGSGGLTVRVPPDTGFDLYAHTGSGRISTDHPITVQGSPSRNELRGKVHGGGSQMELETGSGNIRIE